jgi:hypothetical protein
MPELIDRAEQVNRFKEFVRSYGYELDVTDSGISIEELLKSFESVLKLKETDEDAGTD